MNEKRKSFNRCIIGAIAGAVLGAGAMVLRERQSPAGDGLRAFDFLRPLLAHLAVVGGALLGGIAGLALVAIYLALRPPAAVAAEEAEELIPDLPVGDDEQA